MALNCYTVEIYDKEENKTFGVLAYDEQQLEDIKSQFSLPCYELTIELVD